MKKIDLINELIKKWIQESKTQTIKEKRYINHDTVRNYLNKNYCKYMIERIYNRVFIEKTDINYIIAYYTNSKFIY